MGRYLEYRASFPEGKHNILYFDPEQSPYHCQLVMQRILHLTGLPLDREPEHLHFSHLRVIAEPEIRRGHHSQFAHPTSETHTHTSSLPYN